VLTATQDSFAKGVECTSRVTARMVMSVMAEELAKHDEAPSIVSGRGRWGKPPIPPTDLHASAPAPRNEAHARSGFPIT
jgi:hypothetical protein